MKKLLAAWALVALVFPMVASAATVNVASDGTVWLEKPQSSIAKVEVPFDQGVLEYGDVWKQAFLKPGTVVAIKTHVIYKRDGLFHINETQVADVGIVYDKDGVRLVRDVLLGEPKTDFIAYAIFWLISVLSMTVGVVMTRMGKSGVAVTATAFVAAATTTAAAAAAATTATATAFVAFAFATAFVAFIFATDKKPIYVFAGVYYTAMVASMVAFLLN